MTGVQTCALPISVATDTLMRASHRVAEVLYRGAGSSSAAGSGPAAPGAAPAAGAGPSDVIDAEYVDVDETKKPN